MNRRKCIAAFCILAGIVIMAVPVYLHFHGEARSDALMEDFERIIEEEKDEEAEKLALTAGRKKSESLPDGEGVIGIIEIESLCIRYPVIEGTGNEALNRGIGHLSDTAGIGEDGNCVLCGHNGSRHGTFFTPLSGIEPGAVVELTDAKGDLHDYKVVETRVIQPRDNSIKSTDGTERLTLFTCAQKGTMRFVCVCEPLEADDDEN